MSFAKKGLQNATVNKKRVLAMFLKKMLETPGLSKMSKHVL